MQRNKEVYGARDMFGNEEIRGTKERFKYIKGCLFLLFGCVLLSGCSAFSRTSRSLVILGTKVVTMIKLNTLKIKYARMNFR